MLKSMAVLVHTKYLYEREQLFACVSTDIFGMANIVQSGFGLGSSLPDVSVDARCPRYTRKWHQ